MNSELPERPLTATQWAKRWGVTRKTARSWLKQWHERFGDRVVQRHGKQGSYRATYSQLKRMADGPEAAVVTQVQFTRAMGEVWQAIDTLRRKTTSTG